jgi:hypothetical protein
MATRLTQLRRLALPAGVACVGMYLLIGCIPLPGDYRNAAGGPRPEARIGKAGDDRPIQLGRSTLDNVSSVLGRPRFMTPDGRAVGYGYSVRTGVVLYPLCFMADTNKESRVLVLRFDGAGALQSFKVYKDMQQAPEYEGFMLWQRQMQAQLLRERKQQQQQQ